MDSPKINEFIRDKKVDRLLELTEAFEKKTDLLLQLDPSRLEELKELVAKKPASFQLQYFHFHLQLTLAQQERYRKLQTYKSLKSDLMSLSKKILKKPDFQAFQDFWDVIEELDIIYIADLLVYNCTK